MIPRVNPDDMILSKRMTWPKLKEFLIGRSRTQTIQTWYHEGGDPRTAWTKKENKRLRVLILRRVEQPKKARDMTVNLSEFRRQQCEARCDIEIHDRALVMLPLVVFRVKHIHEILNLPFGTFDFVGSFRDVTNLGRRYASYTKIPIHEFMTDHNQATLSEIEEEGGPDCEELMSYRRRIKLRALRIVDMLCQITQAYWSHYDTPKVLGQAVSDEFIYHFQDVFDVISEAKVSRRKEEDDEI